MKKLLSILLALVLATGLFAACSGSGSGSQAAGSTATGSGAAAAPDGKKTDLLLWLPPFAAGDDACAHDLFDIGKRKTIEIRKLDEAVFGIDALQSRDEGFDDGLFGNVKRERLFAGFKTEERSPVEFIKNKTETLALTHAACSTANQTCNSGHSDATIRRQSLKENAQNRSSNHKTSQNHTCRYGKIFRTKKHLILPDLGTVFTMSICPIVRRR